jgi:RNA polymerase I-specific transcription initiation factor RRN3
LIDRESAPESLDWDDPASFIGQDLPWMPWLRPRLQANIASKFNVGSLTFVLEHAMLTRPKPLKCCSPVIVEEFARLAHHLRLLYIYPQIEKNKFVGIAMTLSYGGSHNTGETAGALRDCGEQRTHLEACFPFDPFQLPVAKRWLDLPNTYMSWQSFAVLEGKEEAETDDGEINDDKDTEDNVSVDEDTATEDEVNYE